MAARNRVEDFYHQECLMRKQHMYPPFFGLFTLLISHPDRVALMRAGQEVARFVGKRLPSGAKLLGPVPAPIPRLKDRYRLQMLIKYDPNTEAVEHLKNGLRGLEQFEDDPELRISIDRDGLIGSIVKGAMNDGDP
jgi:primosomal protein N' (replication factor Y)